MKTNFIVKHKWLALAVTLMIALMAVSISYCAWDTLSVKAIVGAKSGIFTKDKVKYGLAVDHNSNKTADVGDVVTFGNYYQQLTQDGQINGKTPLRWLVADKENGQLTLLTENVIAFGSFWGLYRYDENNVGSFAPNRTGTYYQNYSLSTVRAWLNSYYDLRNDGGTPIAADSEESRFRGFLSEAFSADERATIIDKTISGMKGCTIDTSTVIEDYPTVTDKVWVPSWSEIYGTSSTPEGDIVDGYPNKQMSYFSGATIGKSDSRLVGKTTAYASSRHSNYTDIDAVSKYNYEPIAGNAAVWYLRSRSLFAPKHRYVLGISTVGSNLVLNTDNARGGVRAAIIIPADLI